MKICFRPNQAAIISIKYLNPIYKSITKFNYILNALYKSSINNDNSALHEQ